MLLTSSAHCGVLALRRNVPIRRSLSPTPKPLFFPASATMPHWFAPSTSKTCALLSSRFSIAEFPSSAFAWDSKLFSSPVKKLQNFRACNSFRAEFARFLLASSFRTWAGTSSHAKRIRGSSRASIQILFFILRIRSPLLILTLRLARAARTARNFRRLSSTTIFLPSNFIPKKAVTQARNSSRIF